MSEPLEDFVPESLRGQRRPLAKMPPPKKDRMLIGTIAFLVALFVGVMVLAMLSPDARTEGVAPTVVVMLFYFLAIAVYFIPTFVANSRDHRNATAIAVLNLFLGWTLVGWVVALVWSLYVEKPNR